MSISTTLRKRIKREFKVMDENWLKELNKRNVDKAGEDSFESYIATVFISSTVLKKLSQEEQEKFEISEFKRATNEIEHWARVEEICEFFGVEDPDLAGDVYIRRFNKLTSYEESKWLNLREVNKEIPEGFGVKVHWY